MSSSQSTPFNTFLDSVTIFFRPSVALAPFATVIYPFILFLGLVASDNLIYDLSLATISTPDSKLTLLNCSTTRDLTLFKIICWTWKTSSLESFNFVLKNGESVMIQGDMTKSIKRLTWWSDKHSVVYYWRRTCCPRCTSCIGIYPCCCISVFGKGWKLGMKVISCVYVQACH